MSENAKRLHLKKVFSQKPIASLQPHGSCTQPINSLQPVVFDDVSSQPNNLQQPAVLYHSTNDRLQPLLTCSQQPVKALYNGNGNQSSSNFQQPTVPCNSFTDDLQPSLCLLPQMILYLVCQLKSARYITYLSQPCREFGRRQKN